MTTQEADSKIISAIRSLKKKGIDGEIDFKSDPEKTLYARVPIGSKTGTGDLFATEDGYKLNTRYNQEDYIYDTDDLVEKLSDIAWGWFLDYQYRKPYDYFCGVWKPIWIEQGRISVTQKVVEEYKIN
jgi:hypothetical protein